MPVPHCFDYYSFVVSSKPGNISPPTLFYLQSFFLKDCFGYLGPLQVPAQLIFDKGVKQFSGKKIAFSTNDVEQTIL